MEVMFAAVLLAVVVLLALAASPGWGLLAAQFRALFYAPPPGRVSPPPGKSCEPASAGGRPQSQGRHGAPRDTAHGLRRHTVVPHQARGR
jgi:hypothetical protein